MSLRTLGWPSPWLITIVLLLTGVHAAWLATSADPVVVQRLGAGLIAIGLFSVALPFIRHGIEAEVHRQAPRVSGMFAQSTEATQMQRERREAALPQVRRAVANERIWGALVILVGTLLNGYGDLLWRLARPVG